MKYEPLAQSATIVIVGNFNPAIFNPDGLVRNGLLDSDQLESANVNIIHPEISEFEIAGFTFQVQTKRFQASIVDDPFVKLSDLVARLFLEVLPHTPMTQLGVSYNLHFALDDAEQRLRLGRALAPIAPWGEWGQSLQNSELAKSGGLRSLTLEETVTADRERGYRRVQIEPSIRLDIVSALVGVYMSVNDHFEVADPKHGQTAETVINWMLEHFDSSIEKSKGIVSQMMEFAGTV